VLALYGITDATDKLPMCACARMCAFSIYP